MNYLQNRLVDRILNLWKEHLKLSYQKFYEFFALSDSDNYYDNALCQKLNAEIKILSEKLKDLKSFNLSHELDVYTTPYNPDSVKISFNNWIKRDNKINLTTAGSLATLLSLISFRNDDLFTSCHINFFQKQSYPANLLLDEYGYLFDIIPNSELYNKILENQENLSCFLMALFLYAREELSEDKNLEDLKESIKLWLDKVVLEKEVFSNDKILRNYEKEYYRVLWNESNKIYLKDSNNNPYNIAESKPDLANLYVLPTLTDHMERKVIKPFRGSNPVRFLIQAVTGSGKSTLISALITVILNSRTDDFLMKPLEENLSASYEHFRDYFGLGSNIFPIVIVCDDLTDKKLKKSKIADLALGVTNKKLFRELLKDKNENHNDCLLLIDGLDEVPGDIKKSYFTKTIKKFLDKNKNMSVLITSRPINLGSFSSIIENLDHLSLNPFEPDQKEELIDKWINQDSIHSAKIIKDQYKEILNNEYLEELMVNPYLLTHTLSSLKDMSSPTPNQIISELIDQLIYKRGNLPNNYIDTSLIRNILSEIALEIANTNKHLIEPGDLVKLFKNKTESIIEDIYPNMNKWVSMVKDTNDRAGLIVKTSKGYQFQYKIIEKYLVAEAIRNRLTENYELITKVPDYNIFNDLEKVFPETLVDPFWTDIALILLTPRVIQGRDKLTENVFKFFLNKTSTSLVKEELINLGKLFIYLPFGIFGNSPAVNKKNDNISSGREQIIRFLLQNEHLFYDLSEYKSLEMTLFELLESEVFRDEYELLQSQDLIKTVKVK